MRRTSAVLTHGDRAIADAAGYARHCPEKALLFREVERCRSMSWAQRLKRVFRIDIEHCEQCGGKTKVIASIEDPLTINRILEHLERQARGPPAPSPAT